MNLDHGNIQTAEQDLVVAAQDNNLGPRIERCEFEHLLQRAMEILNARDLKTQLLKNA